MIKKRTKIISLITSFVIFLLFISIFLILISSCNLMAKSLIYPNRQPIIKNPSDYGMEYTNVEFKTPDNLNIKAWFIPGSKDTLALIAHPMNFTRYGYSVKNQGAFKITNIEVEFLKTVKNLNDAGHNILFYDLRNHGESDSSKDGLIGLGLNEWPDVIGAMNYIKQNDKLKNKKIFFVGFCTGANSMIIAMSKKKQELKDVKLLVAIQPISTDIFVEAIFEDKYKAFKPMIPNIEKRAIELGSRKFSELSPEEYMKDIFVPLMVVQAEEDKWTDVETVIRFYEKAPQPKELLLLKGNMHRFDTYNYFGEKPEKLLEFIDKYL